MARWACVSMTAETSRCTTWLILLMDMISIYWPEVWASALASSTCRVLHIIQSRFFFVSAHPLITVIQEVSPHVIITSAKQERCMAQFMQRLGMVCVCVCVCVCVWGVGVNEGIQCWYVILVPEAVLVHSSCSGTFSPLSSLALLWSVNLSGSNPDYRPEVVLYPSVDFGNLSLCQPFLVWEELMDTGFPRGLKKSKILNFKFKALKRLKNCQIFIRGLKFHLVRVKKKFDPCSFPETLAPESYYQAAKKYWVVAYLTSFCYKWNHQNAALRTLVWCVVVLSGGSWCWSVRGDETTSPVINPIPARKIRPCILRVC